MVDRFRISGNEEALECHSEFRLGESCRRGKYSYQTTLAGITIIIWACCSVPSCVIVVWLLARVANDDRDH